MTAYTGWAKSRYTVINYTLYTYFWPTLYMYTGCPGGNVPDFGKMFLKLK